MTILKNILNENTASLLLYGEISDEGGDGKIASRDVVNELMYLDGNYENLNIRINSVGGDVYPGIAIFNAIRQCRSNVTIYIDGIAGSIAGVIALCGRRVEMSRYARMMLHNVSGGCFGNKKDLQDMISTIESLEDTIAEIIGTRSGKDKEEVKSTYFDGTDHWLKADEALGLGLIDAIYDVEPIPEESSTDDIYRIFTNRLELEQQPQNPDKMKLEDVRKIPRFANCADEAAVMAMLGETARKADKADDLEKENGELKEQLQQQEEERIETTVTEAVTDGRIGADQKDTYKNILKADFKNGMSALKALKPKKLLKDKLETGQPQNIAESPWEKKQREIRERTAARN
ncbi:head maturation protease, ClpP-related [Bacteroides cellulosilyticus]|jgi:ATP-dependent Clp endopeptidase proteolytic subunit ClpP|uniref:ATP-dependent Clp protease proteolytic subunit n=1 Tax=Bacteroides cellulosilyticus TaxID=246787 RepID=A0A5M6A239_9BACE|nr:head maturation protease, ClpP-related [Bacteroides cellulosilyticus]KAA5403146.1 Clp protease ClpP [Bacteroides cellulosilyticus]RYU12187.1 Clp protease ClpP [Bacteroides cellulosilyticus]DAT94778.1 MAG TPA: Putative ATP dependent Clp protease [Caudoviricetes sp.]